MPNLELQPGAGPSHHLDQDEGWQKLFAPHDIDSFECGVAVAQMLPCGLPCAHRAPIGVAAGCAEPQHKPLSNAKVGLLAGEDLLKGTNSWMCETCDVMVLMAL